MAGPVYVNWGDMTGIITWLEYVNYKPDLNKIKGLELEAANSGADMLLVFQGLQEIEQ